MANLATVERRFASTAGHALRPAADRRGHLPSDEQSFARWITDNQHINPENPMPAFGHLAPEELEALAAYLRAWIETMLALSKPALNVALAAPTAIAWGAGARTPAHAGTTCTLRDTARPRIAI